MATTKKLWWGYHMDDDYRLCPDADNEWLGTLLDDGGDEVINFQELAVRDWKQAKHLAGLLVKETEV